MYPWMALLFTLLLSNSVSAKTIARVITSSGTIGIELNGDQGVVKNFKDLAEGRITYRNPDGKKIVNTPFYDGLIVHRAHPELGIAMGCPFGNGSGWVGRSWKSEQFGKSKFNEPGLVAMASVPGEQTYSSQFFITAKPAPHLNGRHVILGRVISGMSIVKKLSAVPTSITMKPLKEVKIQSVEIFDTE